ncbi:MAG: hypothetical protein KDM64_06815 [Verrucomicrobiae bacterium]|nr:hypothetical protein [Verrucomicrobiae bacterium]
MLNHAVSTYQTIRDRTLTLEPDLDERTLANTSEGVTELNERMRVGSGTNRTPTAPAMTA